MDIKEEGFDLWWESNAIAMMCEEDEALKIWQAAKAQPVLGGFAVVPIETLGEALSWANCAASESWTDAQREEIDKHYEVIENAMIEAQAVPEGFVLVPINPSEDAIDKLASVICDEFDTTISGSAHCASEAYKSMLAVSQEPK